MAEGKDGRTICKQYLSDQDQVFRAPDPTEWRREGCRGESTDCVGKAQPLALFIHWTPTATF